MLGTRDHYATLGVEQGASAAEVTRAYRRLAKEHHPDATGTEDDERFKEVSEAYAVLSDPERRREYDATLSAASDPWQPSGTGGFSTLLSDLLGEGFGSSNRWWESGRTPFEEAYSSRSGQRRLDQEAELELDLETMETGTTTDLTLSDGQGSRSVRVRIPAGIGDGTRLRLAGQGGRGADGKRGDLYVEVRARPHPRFEVVGSDLVCSVVVDPTFLVVGGEVSCTDLSGDRVVLRVPAGASSGTLRVAGRGLRRNGRRGDLLVRLVPQWPADLSLRERALLEEYLHERGQR